MFPKDIVLEEEISEPARTELRSPAKFYVKFFALVQCSPWCGVQRARRHPKDKEIQA